MTQKEVEYLSLSRDTTETDLKQRREIKSGTAFHVDQVRPQLHDTLNISLEKCVTVNIKMMH